MLDGRVVCGLWSKSRHELFFEFSIYEDYNIAFLSRSLNLGCAMMQTNPYCIVFHLLPPHFGWLHNLGQSIPQGGGEGSGQRIFNF